MIDMYCQSCGKLIPDDSVFCPSCGFALQVIPEPQYQPSAGIVCPNCQSGNVSIQMQQENFGGITVTKSTMSYRVSSHGYLWWLFIGWWWWIVDIFIWIFAFIPRLLYGLVQKRKHGFGKSVSVTKNNIRYKKFCVCQNCGYHWNI